MIVKLLISKDKREILKAVREIDIYRGRHYIQGEITSTMDDILSKAKETNQQQNDISQVQKENPKVNTGSVFSRTHFQKGSRSHNKIPHTY